MYCKNNYKLPLDLRKIVHWHKRASEAHVGRLKNSLDFFAPEGTPIKAALNGEIVWLKNDSNIGGQNKKKHYYAGNRIVMAHKNNEYTAYEHNKYKSAKVKIGQKVKRGQTIALVGSTGWSPKPHLHFEVFNNPDSDKSEGATLWVSFKIRNIGKCKGGCY